MKKILVVLALSLIIFGCGGGSGPAIRDCGSDSICFDQQLTKCTQAKATISDGLATYYMEIKGLDAEKACVTYTKLQSSDSPDLADLIGKEMTCKSQINPETLEFGTPDVSACSGSLVDAMNAIPE
ncbi:MAG: hypothetical protein NT157_04465 [Candidatus Micrarchaeota archaeon]|nr:hypothetical protein [Candidatus Micrarchaeota archaeon]